MEQTIQIKLLGHYWVKKVRAKMVKKSVVQLDINHTWINKKFLI